jgi:hypothetical protein
MERERERKFVGLRLSSIQEKTTTPESIYLGRPNSSDRVQQHLVGNTYSGSTLVAASNSSRWGTAAASPTFTARKRSGLSMIADVSRERMK